MPVSNGKSESSQDDLAQASGTDRQGHSHDLESGHCPFYNWKKKQAGSRLQTKLEFKSQIEDLENVKDPKFDLLRTVQFVRMVMVENPAKKRSEQ